MGDVVLMAVETVAAGFCLGVALRAYRASRDRTRRG